MNVSVRTQQPSLFVYEADAGNGHGVYGVTDIYEVAACRMVCALRTMPPGASAFIRQARLDIMVRPYPSYRYGSVVVRGWRDVDTGTLMIVDADGVSSAGEAATARGGSAV
ncbi:hypothetical protein AB0K60_28105 [Thermopolyspora sp. NPDC052614]|uniref:hypothetical protein n=1 Tax=Thermopolyspora sp. NPDC052614 TaxID=3155682 RepID=UPI00341A3F84